MDKKIYSKITAADLPAINEVLARENTVNIVPTANGGTRISEILRKTIKITRGES